MYLHYVYFLFKRDISIRHSWRHIACLHWVMWTRDADILEKWSPALSQANAAFSLNRGVVVDMQSDSECADQFSFSIFVVLTLGKEHFLLFFLYSFSSLCR